LSVHSLVPAQSTEAACTAKSSAGYTVFEHDGRIYLQLDTYGSNERAIPGKVSPSIQVDENGAFELKQFLERTFPGV
jgi:hypothetical protein